MKLRIPASGPFITGTADNQRLAWNNTTQEWDIVAGGGGGGAQTWAQTLALGNVSGGVSPVISSGDSLLFLGDVANPAFILSEDSTTAADAQPLQVEGGANTSTGDGGEVVFKGGDAAGVGTGADASLVGGDSAAGSGGDAIVRAGVGVGAPQGGEVSLIAPTTQVRVTSPQLLFNSNVVAPTITQATAGASGGQPLTAQAQAGVDEGGILTLSSGDGNDSGDAFLLTPNAANASGDIFIQTGTAGGGEGGGSGLIHLRTGGTTDNGITIGGTIQLFQDVVFDAGVTDPSISQSGNPVTGNEMTLQPQSGSTTGGNLNLLSGSGTSRGNISLLQAATTYGNMTNGIFINNAGDPPTGNPLTGGFLYVNAGALTYRGSGGTVTVVGPA